MIRNLGELSDVTYHRWRSEFGGPGSDLVRRMKDLELENQRLRKAVSDLTLDKLRAAASSQVLLTLPTGRLRLVGSADSY